MPRDASFWVSECSFLPFHAPSGLGRRSHSHVLPWPTACGLARQEEGRGVASASPSLCLARHSKQARQPQAPSTSTVSENKQGKSCSVCLPSSLSPCTTHCTQQAHARSHTHSQACREPRSFVLPFGQCIGRCPFRRLCFKPPPSHAWLSLRALSLPSRHVQNPQGDIERRYNK